MTDAKPTKPRARSAGFDLIALAVLTMLGLQMSKPAIAQSFPQRTITLVAATAAGGPGDAAARIIADRMGTLLGQPMVVENVPGAGGLTGSVRVARAEPDGHTLLVHQTGIAIGPALGPTPGLDVAKDLTAVGLVNTSYLMLAGRADLPANTLPELVEWMKRSGQSVRFAHPGTGSLGHLSLLLLAKAASVDPTPVPYRGMAPAMNDILGGHVDLAWPAVVIAAPLLQAGKVKAFVIGAPKRSALAPTVASAVELGFPDLDIPFWHCLFAPAATPRPIIDALNSALKRALDDPAVIKAFADGGMEAFPPSQLSPEAANAFIARELARWSKVAGDSSKKQ